MMSTGLTFGTISALFGINHGIIDQAQYSHLVATVIGSAVIPTMIANAWFMPRHLLRKSVEEKPVAQPVTLSAARGNSGAEEGSTHTLDGYWLLMTDRSTPLK